jgi:hypothetical protein
MIITGTITLVNPLKLDAMLYIRKALKKFIREFENSVNLLKLKKNSKNMT